MIRKILLGAELLLAYALIVFGSLVAIEKGPPSSGGVPIAGALLLVARAVRDTNTRPQ